MKNMTETIQYYMISKGLEIVVFPNKDIQIRKENKVLNLDKQEIIDLNNFIEFLDIFNSSFKEEQ